jgi:hypothetical protein
MQDPERHRPGAGIMAQVNGWLFFARLFHFTLISKPVYPGAFADLQSASFASLHSVAVAGAKIA